MKCCIYVWPNRYEKVSSENENKHLGNSIELWNCLNNFMKIFIHKRYEIWLQPLIADGEKHCS